MVAGTTRSARRTKGASSRNASRMGASVPLALRRAISQKTVRAINAGTNGRPDHCDASDEPPPSIEQPPCSGAGTRWTGTDQALPVVHGAEEGRNHEEGNEDVEHGSPGMH